jgi:hypothetical protein
MHATTLSEKVRTIHNNSLIWKQCLGGLHDPNTLSSSQQQARKCWGMTQENSELLVADMRQT